jgi:hypothetical protein
MEAGSVYILCRFFVVSLIRYLRDYIQGVCEENNGMRKSK